MLRSPYESARMNRVSERDNIVYAYSWGIVEVANVRDEGTRALTVWSCDVTC